MENPTPLNLEKVVTYPNVAEHLDEDYLHHLGQNAVRNFEDDLITRSEWETKNEMSMKLALQIMEQKTYPWPGASNIKFPLITIAALQYHARAYPALISNDDIVRYQVFGDDPDGQKNALGEKIAKHMTYQLTEENTQWEPDTDKALLVQPIVGCAFKKTYFDPIKDMNISELVFPKDLVVSYYTKNLESCPRVSHVIYRTKNDIYERVQSGLFLDVELANQNQGSQGRLDELKDKQQGMHDASMDREKPFELIEQHCFIDLDNDGYQEPYVITVHRASMKVLRIVARFNSPDIKMEDKKLIYIKPIHYFTKIPFIPAPDGGFYDIGLGSLLSPLNDSINTLLNQLVDAGTLSNLGGGFLGRGVKTKSGNMTFTPGEWKRIDSTGDDLAKNVFPLPIREPSNVLFQLLNLLIGYGERVAGSTDSQVGITPGQNTPAETSRVAEANGMRVFSSIFKRTYLAFRDEFRKLYLLNQIHLSDTPKPPFGISSKDYMADPIGIRPSAEPNIMSDGQRVIQAQILMEAAKSVPGFDIYKTVVRYLKSHKIPAIDEVYPNPQGPRAVKPQPNPKMLQVQNEMQKTQLQAQKQEFDIKAKTAELLQDAELVAAQIKDLESKAAKNLAAADGVKDGHQLALINAELGISKAKHEGMLKAIQILGQLGDKADERTHEARLAQLGDKFGN